VCGAKKTEVKKKRGGEKRKDTQDRRTILSYCGTNLVKKNFPAPALTRRGARENNAFGTFSWIFIGYLARLSPNLNSALLLTVRAQTLQISHFMPHVTAPTTDQRGAYGIGLMVLACPSGSAICSNINLDSSF
jgi:hypothetical protein